MSLFHRSKPAEEPVGPVTYLSYSRSEMRFHEELIFAKNEEGVYTLTRQVGYNDDERRAVTVPASVGEDIWRIMQNEKILNYKESYAPRVKVLDGYMWSLGASFAKGKHFRTEGDNEIPDGGEGIDKLVKYLRLTWFAHAEPLHVKNMCYQVSGMTMYPIVYFALQRDEKNHLWLVNGSECAKEMAKKVQVSKTFEEQFWQIVVEEQMLGYERTYEPEYQVLDGESWYLDLSFIDSDAYVYSSGHEAYPYGQGLQRIRQLCFDTWTQLEKKAKPSPIEF